MYKLHIDSVSCNSRLLLCVGLIFMIKIGFAQNNQSTTRPNVVLIVTDDQGYGDLGSHGNPVINTPNMDDIYHHSVRFSNFHVDPTCAPTRAALLTGKYSHHVGVWHTVSGGNHLRSSEITLADTFKSSGYRTGIFGKWHLGSNYPYRPMDRGFDEWLGQGDGGTGTTDDWFDNDRVNDYYWHNGNRVQRNGYAPDLFYDAAIDFIKETKDNNEPFFVYLPTYLPHGPHTLPDKKWIEKYKDRIPDYMAYFFASIERVDWNIGRFREALAQLGLAKNTILIFMSDNGGTAGVKLFNAGMRGHKGQVYDGGHRVPFFMHWPEGNIKHGTKVSDLTAHIDVMPSLIDICGLKVDTTNDFDGRSFKTQLYQEDKKLPGRILFVETQRTFKAISWENTAGMTNRWRLIDNHALYDILKDPGQTTNIIENHPDVVERIRQAHNAYWKKVTPNDRETPRFIVGSPEDKEIFLQPSDWYLPDVPWNHAQVAAGSSFGGSWEISVATDGKYEFEVRRWPKEANASMRGVPTFENKTVDAWHKNGGIRKLIYGKEMVALRVKTVKLEVGNIVKIKKVGSKTKATKFHMELQQGDTRVKGSFIDDKGNLISGSYYLYVTKKEM